MKAADIEEIRSLPLFGGMGNAAFDALIRGAYVQSFPPHVELIGAGQPSDFLQVLIEGAVELIAEWNGRETVMAIVRPLGTFILAATVNDAPYLMSARTITRSRLILLPSEDVRAAIASDGSFARAVLGEMAGSYRALVKETKSLKLRSSIERLANYLLRRQAAEGGAARFDLDIEKRRLAAYLGMTAENLSRAIRALRPYGVAIDGSAVTITNRHDLAQMAKPAPLIDDPTS